MCFYKSKQSKILVAKKDIKVRKIGTDADRFGFIPYFKFNFCYVTGIEDTTNPNFNISDIEKGFHSYINIITKSYYDRSVLHVNVHKNTKRAPLVSIYSVINKPLYIGKFIIPKGATYCVNTLNEVVSDKIIYTGEYTLIQNKYYLYK